MKLNKGDKKLKINQQKKSRKKIINKSLCDSFNKILILSKTPRDHKKHLFEPVLKKVTQESDTLLNSTVDTKIDNGNLFLSKNFPNKLLINDLKSNKFQHNYVSAAGCKYLNYFGSKCSLFYNSICNSYYLPSVVATDENDTFGNKRKIVEEFNNKVKKRKSGNNVVKVTINEPIKNNVSKHNNKNLCNYKKISCSKYNFYFISILDYIICQK